jgi:hypothetical protein
VTGAPENLSSTGNDSGHRTRPTLLGMSKTPNLFGVLGKPPKNTPTPKVSANLWLLWQMWRIDNLLLEIPPEPQSQMKLRLAGSAGMRDLGGHRR